MVECIFYIIAALAGALVWCFGFALINCIEQKGECDEDIDYL